MTAFLRALLLFLTGVCALPAGAETPVVLLRSDTSAAFFRVNGGDYERVLKPWRELFSRHGMAAREHPAAELAALGARGVLILASSAALSDAEREAIRGRIAAGWSVLGTWAVGVRDGKGQWSGYGFIEETFAAKVASDLPPSRDESFLLPYGETPLTHALPAGKRIYLEPSSGPFLRVRTANAAARFGSYMREVTAPGALLAAAAFDERAGSRRAFFGFPETAWDTAQADVDALMIGTLRWLQRRPLALKSAWPHPYQSAVLLEMDTEDKFDNSLRFAEQLERHNIRGTFYSVTSEAQKFPEVVKRLGARHEIAYHAEVHNGFAKLGRKEQEARLALMVRQLAKLVPDVAAATGFRAPLEQYDANTEIALRAIGIRHHAASPAARDDALPGFSTAEPKLSTEEALVVLPRTWLDDINLFTTGLLKGTPAEQMLLNSLQDTQAMRSFGLLSLHTQNFYAGSVLERVFPRLLQRISQQRDQVWTPSGSTLTAWWRDREAVQLSAREEPGALRIRLQAARGPIANLRIVIMPPSDAIPVLDRADARAQQLDAQRWAIVFPQLQAGVTDLTVRF